MEGNLARAPGLTNPIQFKEKLDFQELILQESLNTNQVIYISTVFKRNILKQPKCPSQGAFRIWYYCIHKINANE